MELKQCATARGIELMHAWAARFGSEAEIPSYLIPRASMTCASVTIPEQTDLSRSGLFTRKSPRSWKGSKAVCKGSVHQCKLGCFDGKNKGTTGKPGSEILLSRNGAGLGGISSSLMAGEEAGLGAVGKVLALAARALLYASRIDIRMDFLENPSGFTET
jgi:hypothetical protein